MFKNKTSRSLVMSAISVVLCLVMFLGATYAWFTSSVTSGTNTVRTAGFDATLQYSTDFDHWSNLTDSSVLFNDVVLAPGEASSVVYVKIHNGNSYAISGSLALGSVSITGDNNDLLLRKKAVTAVATVADLDAGTSLLNAATLISGQEIAAGSDLIVALAIELPTSAITPNVTATFTITLGASQIGA